MFDIIEYKSKNVCIADRYHRFIRLGFLYLLKIKSPDYHLTTENGTDKIPISSGKLSEISRDGLQNRDLGT